MQSNREANEIMAKTINAYTKGLPIDDLSIKITIQQLLPIVTGLNVLGAEYRLALEPLRTIMWDLNDIKAAKIKESTWNPK
jgi:hypothetical protein